MPATQSGVSSIGRQLLLNSQAGDTIFSVHLPAWVPGQFPRGKRYGYVTVERWFSASVALVIDGESLWTNGIYLFPRNGTGGSCRLYMNWLEVGVPWVANSGVGVF